MISQTHLMEWYLKLTFWYGISNSPYGMESQNWILAVDIKITYIMDWHLKIPLWKGISKPPYRMVSQNHLIDWYLKLTLWNGISNSLLASLMLSMGNWLMLGMMVPCTQGSSCSRLYSTKQTITIEK